MTDLREALQQAAKAGHLPLPEGAAVRRSALRRRARRRSGVAAAAAVGVVIAALQFTPMPVDPAPTVPATPAPTSERRRPAPDQNHYPEVSVGDLQPGRYGRLAGVRLALEAAKGAEVTDRPAFFYLPCQGTLRVSGETPARTALVESDSGQNGEFDVERIEVSAIALRDHGEVGKAVDEAKRLLRTCVGPQRDTEAGPPSFTVSGRELSLGDGAVALTARTINGSGGADLLIVAVGDLLYLAQTGDNRMPEQEPFDAKRLLVEQLAADEPALRIRHATTEPGPTDCASNAEMPACRPGHESAD